MIWTTNFIYLVNLVQVSFPSVLDIVSRTRFCLRENAHCPINIYKNLDLCCKPFVCTVIPKTCKPNFINRYFHISNYKDRRCLLPSKPVSLTEMPSESITMGYLNSTYSSEDVVVTTVSEFTSEYSNDTEYSKDSNMTEADEYGDSIHNTTLDTILNKSDLTKETSYEFDDDATDSPLEPLSHGSSLLDSQSYFIDSNNEIRRLVKRYVSNDSSSENSLSLSSIEGGNNDTFEQGSQFSNSSSESGSGNSFGSSQTQGNGSQEFSESEDVSGSGEVYDYDGNETKIESNKQSFKDNFEHNSSETIFSTTPSILTDSKNDWHSSDMELDTRSRVFKVVTVKPFGWFQSDAQVIKLNLSSEISE